MVQSEMEAAEQSSRKNRKPGPGTDALANGARLAVLEKHLGIPMKRFRDPGTVSGTMGADGRVSDKPVRDESQIVWRESG